MDKRLKWFLFRCIYLYTDAVRWTLRCGICMFLFCGLRMETEKSNERKMWQWHNCQTQLELKGSGHTVCQANDRILTFKLSRYFYGQCNFVCVCVRYVALHCYRYIFCIFFVFIKCFFEWVTVWILNYL